MTCVAWVVAGVWKSSSSTDFVDDDVVFGTGQGCWATSTSDMSASIMNIRKISSN